MTEKFIYWLENEYDYGKFGRPLKSSSAEVYANGIKSINKKLGFLDDEIYDKDLRELVELKVEVDKNANKDRKSHFEALIKFREKQDKIKSTEINSFNRQKDILKKQEVERVAINTVIEHFTGLDYTVSSKEKDNLGWDLEAVKTDEELKIEVKGLSGKTVSFEFSPNEYAKSKEYSENYVIAVVTNCLELPVLHNFRFYKKDNYWKDRFENKLVIIEKIGARMSVKNNLKSPSQKPTP